VFSSASRADVNTLLKLKSPWKPGRYHRGYNVTVDDSLNFARPAVDEQVIIKPLSSIAHILTGYEKRRLRTLNLPGPIARQLPVYITGVAPITNSRESVNFLPALFQRIGRQVPKIKPDILNRFRGFCWHYCCEHFTPLAADWHYDIESWLESSTYTGVKKDELRRLFVARQGEVDKLPNFDDGWRESLGTVVATRDNIVRVFPKAQWWPTYKHMRYIMPRSDASKLLIAPFTHAVEQLVYDSDKHFIKHVAVADRPDKISSLHDEVPFTVNRIWATDHTAFEAHFHPDLMANCEFILYNYFAMYSPIAREIVSAMRHMYMGINHLNCGEFVVSVPGRRMSGDMVTSLGNGFTNLMLMLFAAHERHFNVDGFVEGDDGIFVTDALDLPSTYFDDLGFEVKVEVCDDLSTASFCGNIFSPYSKRNICDPIARILRSGWTLKKSFFNCGRVKQLGLQRAIALSLAASYPGCPILSSYYRMLLKMTEGIDPVFGDTSHDMDWWEAVVLRMDYKDKTIKALNAKPRPCDRKLMQTVFDISITDQQIIEHDIEDCAAKGQFELKSPTFLKYCKQENFKMWRDFTYHVETNS